MICRRLISSKYSAVASTVEKSDIQEKLQDIVLNGNDIYTNTDYTATAQVYSIRNISPNCSVALRIEDGEEYYIYSNRDYSPKTLANLAEDFNFKDTLTVYSASDYDENGEKIYEITERDDYIKNALLGFLLSNADVTEKAERGSVLPSNQTFKLTVFSFFGASRHTHIIWLTSNGYFVTNAVFSPAFYIGKEKINEFIDSLYENCPYKEVEMVIDKGGNSGIDGLYEIPEYEYVPIEE